MPDLFRLHTVRLCGDRHSPSVTGVRQMSLSVESPCEVEPPSRATVDDASCAARVDRIMAITHLPVAAHVALIGHHTLPLLLALLQRGCGAGRCLRPGVPSPDRETADLAWIVDVQGDEELDEALRAARA